MKIVFLTIAIIVSLAMGTDKHEPLIIPPGEIASQNAPMLVCVGWDDNAYFDAVNWFSDWSRNKVNKDGSPARTTFLSATSLIAENFNVAGNPNSTKDALLAAWKTLYDDGHEYGNHTHNHYHGTGKEKSWWDDEIEMCNKILLDKLGIPQSEITGFRTPFLEYSAGTFASLKERGGEYDCSIEAGYNSFVVKPAEELKEAPWYIQAIELLPGKASAGKMYYWPYTLDNGPSKGVTLASGSSAINKIPGFWEIPVFVYNTPTVEWDENNPEIIDDKWEVTTTTGFDFNMWKQKSKEDFLRTLKFSFHQRLSGNRSPFNLNLHTDNYSQWNSEAIDKEFLKSTWQERREAIEEFLEYVLQFEEVRVVPYNAVIDYMRNPETHDDYVAPTKSGSGASTIHKTKLKGGTVLSIASNTNSQLLMNVPVSGNYSVQITSMNGRVIDELYSGNLSLGEHSFNLSGIAATGIYLVNVQGVVNSTARIILK